MNRATTSASNLFRRALCPGSAKAEEGLAEQDSDYSAEGTMLHALYMTGQRPETLTPEQAEALDTADEHTNRFFDALREAHGIPADAEYWDEREQELAVCDAEGRLLFPGHADLIRVWPEHAVGGIADAKFGFMEVEHAADNKQLAGYAVALWQAVQDRHPWRKLKAIGVCIAQPRNFGPRSSAALYTGEQMPGTLMELERIIDATQQPGAPRIPGAKQCHYCKAKVTCPEYKGQFIAIQQRGTIAVETLSDAELEQVHLAIGFAAKISDDVKAEIKRRINAGGMPGWKLRSSGENTFLNDTLGFYNALAAYFSDKPEFTATGFDACRKMNWGELTKVVQAAGHMGKKRAEELIDQVAAPFVTKEPKAKAIIRDKKATPALEN